ncbi:hypothetical protein ScPMuIL_013472 [Solemya velum]
MTIQPKKQITRVKEVKATKTKVKWNCTRLKKILGTSKTNGKLRYKVRWKGYGSADDTWEPRENLESCLDLIEEFELEREKLRLQRSEEKKKQKALMIGEILLPGDKSSSDECNTFWKDLEEGKVNVFATDMYSKVKSEGRSRSSKKQKSQETSAGDDESKCKRRKLTLNTDIPKLMEKQRPLKKKKDKKPGKKKKQKNGSKYSKSSTETTGQYRVAVRKSVSFVTSSQETNSDVSAWPLSDASESIVSSSQGEVGVLSQTDSLVTSSQECDSTKQKSKIQEYSDEDILISDYSIRQDGQTSVALKHIRNDDKKAVIKKKQIHKTPEYLPLSESTESESENTHSTQNTSSESTHSTQITGSESTHSTQITGSMDKRDSKAEKLVKRKSIDKNKFFPECQIKPNSSGRVEEHTEKAQSIQNGIPHVSSSQSIRRSLFDSAEPICKKKGTTLDKSLFDSFTVRSESTKNPHNSCKTSDKAVRTQCLNTSSPMKHVSEKVTGLSSVSSTMGVGSPSTARSADSVRKMNNSMKTTEKSSPNIRRKESYDIPMPQPLDNIWNSTFLPILPESAKSQDRGGDLGFEIELDDLDWEQFEQQSCEVEPLVISDDKLHNAVLSGDYTLVQRALSSSKVYDLDNTDHTGMTLLMHAVRQGFDDIVEMLILTGANINTQHKNGTTALMLACEEAHICTIALLVELGANLNLVQDFGDTALMKAAKRGHKQIVKFMLESGANFSAHNAQGITAMSYANMYNNNEIEDLINEHIMRLEIEFKKQVCITLNNTAQIICSLFPLQCFPLSESDNFVIQFKHDLQPMTPGVGYLLFIAHARITGQEVKCRFYGQCDVKSAFLNGVQQPSLTEEANFVMSFCPLNHGKNEIVIQTMPAPTSKVKLVVCAYKAQLLDPSCQMNAVSSW